MSRRSQGLSLAALSLLFAVFAVVPAAAQDGPRSAVTVSGEGRVATQPDQAIVRFGVVTRAETAREARSRNATAAKNAMNAVRALDVPEEKMRTESLRLQPQYEYDDEANRRELVGYEASRHVVVELDRLEVLPQLVADVVENGANRVDNIDYQLSDRTQFRNEALQEAAQEARDKARLLAETLDATLGPVHTINEKNFDFVRPQPQAARMGMAKATDAGQAEPEAYAAGEIEVTAQVQVAFDLVTNSNR
jgi:uncharacterized protein YggE